MEEQIPNPKNLAPADRPTDPKKRHSRNKFLTGKKLLDKLNTKKWQEEKVEDQLLDKPTDPC